MPIERDVPAKPPRPLSMRAVNGWRGPGAIAIALAHLWAMTDMFPIAGLEPITLLVDLFFVLSGLLIAQVYMEQLRRPAAIPEYIVRRFGRIWPVQAATLAILVGYEIAKRIGEVAFGLHFSAPAFASDGVNLASAIWTNLLLVHSLGLHDRETWNYPSWSLSVEFCTYAVFALFCLLRPWLRRALAVTTIVASIAILVVVAPFHMRSTFDFGVFRCLAGFFAGTLCYEIVQRMQPGRWPLPTLMEAAALAGIVLWLALAVGTYWAFAAPLVICLFITAFLPERGLLSRVLVLKPVQILAELSFAIYMVHALILTAVLAAFHAAERIAGHPLFVSRIDRLAGSSDRSILVHVIHLEGFGTKLLVTGVYLAVVLLAAYAIHRLVEVPGRAFFSRLAKRMQQTPQRLQKEPRFLKDPLEPTT